MIYVKLAWRNLFRNKRRTIISGTAIGMGLVALIFTDAVLIGMSNNYVHNATSSFMGEAQILRKGFRETMDVDASIVDFTKVISDLEKEPIVDRFAPRTSAFGTITSATNMSGVNIFGVDPEREKYLSVLKRSVSKGEYFSGDNPRDILIGDKLADVLDVGLGDRIVLTVAQSGSGEIAQELFRVSGIFDFGERSMNAGAVFIRLDKSREMLNIGESAHMIAIKFTDPKMSEDASLPFWSNYSKNGNEAVSWEKIFPQLVSMFSMLSVLKLVLSFMLMGVVVFVILNTLFMALYERIFEFGVLKAIGTRPWAIAKLLMFEAGALAIISIAIGALLGLGITALVGKIGIDYSGIEFGGITMREKIYPVLTLWQFIAYPIGVFLFTVIVGTYPALHAARLEPAEALRKSM